MNNISYDLARLMSFVFEAHSKKPLKHGSTTRRWDEKTPYFIHPVWCAMTILSEVLLSETLRLEGAETLLLHDIKEETYADLPIYLSDEVFANVTDMTFVSSAEEMVQIWSKSSFIKLLKLYDKTSNLLDSKWMGSEKLAKYCDYTLKLVANAEREYGLLNIVLIAKTIVAERQKSIGR